MYAIYTGGSGIDVCTVVSLFRLRIVAVRGHYPRLDDGDGRRFRSVEGVGVGAERKMHRLYGVPTMFIAELNHPMFDMFDLSSLRTGIMAGAPCPIETLKQVMDKMYCRDIISVYGLTESSPGMTATRVTDPPEIRATTVGRSLPFVEVKVLDPETNQECPVGVQGEMCCKGYNIMKGYYKNPEATAAIIDENGFLHSETWASWTNRGISASRDGSRR